MEIRAGFLFIFNFYFTSHLQLLFPPTISTPPSRSPRPQQHQALFTGCSHYLISHSSEDIPNHLTFQKYTRSLRLRKVVCALTQQRTHNCATASSHARRHLASTRGSSQSLFPSSDPDTKDLLVLLSST
jgi:hypothetical protein